MQLAHMESGFFEFWNAGEIEKQTGSDKIIYRVIGGYKFQFRKSDFKQRTALAIEIMAVAKELMPIFGRAQALADADAGDNDNAQTDAADLAFLDLMPDLIGALATPNLQTLVDKLCATASVDAGEGKFEPLTDDIVGEKVFGPDITLQIPVALTAAMLNLDTLFDKIKAAA